MTYLDLLERRVTELEDKLERAARQIETLECQVQELQNPKPPIGTGLPTENSGPLPDLSKEKGKLY
jgi:hypothetical protein